MQVPGTYDYRTSVIDMLNKNQVRLIVNLDDLRDYDRALADG